jgi:hypothetical protein
MSLREEQETRGHRELSMMAFQHGRWRPELWLQALLIEFSAYAERWGYLERVAIAEGELWWSPVHELDDDGTALGFEAPDVPVAFWYPSKIDLVVTLITNNYLYAAIGALCAWRQEHANHEDEFSANAR